MVAADKFVFPSGVEGSGRDPFEQVDQAVAQLHESLRRIGLGIGNMLQHTIYLKNGAADPIDVIQRFHRAARGLAPSLEERPSVGTIVRVPRFSDEATNVMLDIVAGKGSPEDFYRVPFDFGPREIAETITLKPLIFTAGMEAMDFEHGSLTDDLDTQIEYVVMKIDSALRKSGSTIADVISRNIYVQSGTDPGYVARKFDEEARKRAPDYLDTARSGIVAVVDGMALDGFRLEVDAVAAHTEGGSAGDELERLEGKLVGSARAGGLVFMTSIAETGFAVEGDILRQMRVVLERIEDALTNAGSSIGNVVKYKIHVAASVAEPDEVMTAFHKAAGSLAPGLADYASTLVVVERLATAASGYEVSVVAARH